MRIAQKYSHLNGEEYLIVHHQKEYQEIADVINRIDANIHKTKVSDEKGRKGALLYNPATLNADFKQKLNQLGWHERRRDFYVSTDFDIVNKIEPLNFQQQKKFLEEIGHPLYSSYNQTDFLKNKIGKAMQKDMSSGPPWFEKEIHNVMRHGRTNPPVPLLILGIEP